jgi:hypothetical protein
MGWPAQRGGILKKIGGVQESATLPPVNRLGQAGFPLASSRGAAAIMRGAEVALQQGEGLAI